MTIVNGEPKANENAMTLVPDQFRNLVTGETVMLDHFHGGPVHAIAGIGNPDRFFETLRKLGLTIEAHPFPDHYGYEQRDIQLQDTKPVIMTEKDAVKCEQFADQRHWSLVVSARPDDDVIDQLSHWLEKEVG